MNPVVPCLGWLVLAAYPETRELDALAHAVASSDEFAWVGSHGSGSDGREPGSVGVYFRQDEEWSFLQTLTGEDSEAGDSFGFSLAMSDGVAVVGAPRADAGATDCGAAYVYRLQENRWIQEQKLVASDAWRLDFFGHSVDVGGDTIVVGSPYRDESNTDTGAAYVFRFDGEAWTEVQKLTANDAERSDQFGASVSLSGERIVVGSPWNAGLIGAAYVFRRSDTGWEDECKLTPSDGTRRDRFGSSVSIFDDLVAVGAAGHDRKGASDRFDDSGATYLYRLHEDGGAALEEARLESDDATDQAFGLSVHALSDRVLVAARGAGAEEKIHVYRRQGRAWQRKEALASWRDGLLAGFDTPLDRCVAEVGLWPGVAMADELDAKSYEHFRQLILPTDNESHWAKIPWMIDFPAAREKAAELGKPLVVWRMVGEPLGFC